MTKKDFELIAKTIAHLQWPSETAEYLRTMVAKTFALALRSTNPNFDSERFIEACAAYAAYNVAHMQKVHDEGEAARYDAIFKKRGKKARGK